MLLMDIVTNDGLINMGAIKLGTCFIFEGKVFRRMEIPSGEFSVYEADRVMTGEEVTFNCYCFNTNALSFIGPDKRVKPIKLRMSNDISQE